MEVKYFEAFQYNMMKSIEKGLNIAFKDEGIESVRKQIVKMFNTTQYLSDSRLTLFQSDTLKKNLRAILAELSCYFELLEYKRTLGSNVYFELVAGRIFPLQDKDSMEVDLILITENKIFVIETKAIYGDLIIEEDGSVLSQDSKFRVNPVNQNVYHILNLKTLLQDNIIINSDRIYENIVYLYSDSKVSKDFRSTVVKDKAYFTNTHTITATISHLNRHVSNYKLNCEEIYRTLINKGVPPTLNNKLQHIKNKKQNRT